MPRVLSMQRATVPAGERARYFERLRAKKAYYAGLKCKFWVFEETALPGAFVEFVEAADSDTLTNALSRAPDFVLDPSRVYTETELD
jgi:hypothetical protein